MPFMETKVIFQQIFIGYLGAKSYARQCGPSCLVFVLFSLVVKGVLV